MAGLTAEQIIERIANDEEPAVMRQLCDAMMPEPTTENRKVK